MGPWASVIVSVASVGALFIAVMAFRGLMEAVEHATGRCDACGRTPMLPVPLRSHRCWRCHYLPARRSHAGGDGFAR
jgi:hypothetical protein